LGEARSAKRGQSYKMPRLKAPAQRYRTYEASTEEEHRTAEQFSWRNSYRLNRAVAAAALLAVLFAAGSFCETRRQAQIAQYSATQSARAWVNPNIDVSSVSIKWKDDVPTVHARLTVSNEGGSPSIDTEFFPAIFVPENGDTFDIRNKVKTYCRGSSYVGNILFAKDAISLNEESSMDAETAHAWIRKMKSDLQSNEIPPFPIELAVCGRYNIVGDNSPHYTIKVYFALTETGNVPAAGKDLQAGQVHLDRWFDGEYAD
jgi:hypothetical protein